MSCRLWEEGWKQRYYKNKFDVDATDEDFRRKVVQSYVEGLCWVLRYYYQVTLKSHGGFSTVYKRACLQQRCVLFFFLFFFPPFFFSPAEKHILTGL